MEDLKKGDERFENNILNFTKAIFIVSAVLIVVTIMIYFSSGFINLSLKVDPTVIGTFGDFIGGFIGTLLTLVTVLLVWLTYSAQKKEFGELVNQGRKQLKIQQNQAKISLEMQAEATFFNLLNHHKEVVKTTSILEPNELNLLWYHVALSNLSDYYSSIEEKYFTTCYKTSWSPNLIFDSKSDLSVICDSIELIVELIHKNLEDKLFYHKILFSNLTDSEKFIYGLGISIGKHNSLTPKFDYKQFYLNKVGVVHDELNYLPAVRIKIIKERLQLEKFEDLKLKHDKFSFHIDDLFQKLGTKVLFSTIIYINSAPMFVERIEPEGEFVRFAELFNSLELYKKVDSLKSGSHFDFKMDIQMCLRYNGVDYIIVKKIGGSIGHFVSFGTSNRYVIDFHPEGN